MPRKTTPRVKLGAVQKKNNWQATPDPVFLAGTAVAFERRRPGPGYKHLIRRVDLDRFVALLPDWDELAGGLKLVVLDAGNRDMEGWHYPGAIGLTAWDRELWIDCHPAYVEQHRAVLDRLEVAVVQSATGMLVEWTESTARAYQLLHVFLHELDG